MWQTNEFADEHDGRPAAVLADGSEPKPLIYDIGSGSNFHSSTDWWDYDGTLGAPKAAGVRAQCSCGWYGEKLYPIDWEKVDHSLPTPFNSDTEGPLGDWQVHVAVIEAQAVPVPQHVQELLDRIDVELEKLADEAPLAALRAAGALQRTATRIGADATHHLGQDEVSVERIAVGLGISPTAARSRLNRYER
ncbi:hypothetical protein [Streptomyces sp. NPDC051000]|uniref:hypothetical protein n=1 Tax=Streptomyces sp. NPDC051000 TaxID=3155520 RepID=UPI0033FDD880